MKPRHVVLILSLPVALLCLISCSTSTKDHSPAQAKSKVPGEVMTQVPTWSHADLDFFLHGSMVTEFVPEAVLRAFMRTYPDLFPMQDFSHLGAVPDPAFGWPVGFSRNTVSHLGGLPAVGINCAACHVGEITPAGGGANVRFAGHDQPV